MLDTACLCHASSCVARELINVILWYVDEGLGAAEVGWDGGAGGGGVLGGVLA